MLGAVVCGEQTVPTANCADLQVIRVSPRDTVLAVGDRLQPDVAVIGPFDGVVRTSLCYLTADTTVVRIRTSAPRLEALKLGSAAVEIRDARIGYKWFLSPRANAAQAWLANKRMEPTRR